MTQHTPETERPELSFDGKGINGPDEHRTRVATFTGADAAKKYGPLFAIAPELLDAARDMLTVWDGVAHPSLAYPEGSPAARLRDLIAKTTQA